MNWNILLDEAEIAAGVARIAREIRADFPTETLHLVGVLKGSLYFLADLSRHLSGDVLVDFIQVSSYGNERASSGIIRVMKDLDNDIEGKTVLIVEDIVDSGQTLSHLVTLFQTRKPKALKVAALLSKPEARRVQAPIDYVGFEIPNEFVVGYGLDEAERYRNLPFIALLSEP